MSEQANEPKCQVKIHTVVEFGSDDPGEVMEKLTQFLETMGELGFKWEIDPSFSGRINGKPIQLKSVDGVLQAVDEPEPEETVKPFILGATPPMSFKEAKAMLHPHLNTSSSQTPSRAWWPAISPWPRGGSGMTARSPDEAGI